MLTINLKLIYLFYYIKYDSLIMDHNHIFIKIYKSTYILTEYYQFIFK